MHSPVSSRVGMPLKLVCLLELSLRSTSFFQDFLTRLMTPLIQQCLDHLYTCENTLAHSVTPLKDSEGVKLMTGEKTQQIH